MNESGVRAGKSYLFFGRSEGWAQNTSLSQADVTLLGDGATSEAAHVCGPGDVNGDGIADVMVGAGFHDQAGDNAGKAYLIFGRPAAEWPQQINLADADASYLGELSGDWAGHRVAGAGDVNGDAHSELPAVLIICVRVSPSARNLSGSTCTCNCR